MLIDPLSLVEDFGESGDRLNKGAIDIRTLGSLLSPCWLKESAVVLLWAGFAHKAGHFKKGMTYGWLKAMCEQKDAAIRCHHNARSHSIFIVGIGKGKAIVEQLASQAAWQSSWLCRTVYEGV